MAVLVNQLQPTTESNYVSLDVAIGTAGELGSIITIDSEQMLVRDGLGTTGLDVERGVNGTTIAAHQVGASVSVTRRAATMYEATLSLTAEQFDSLANTPITVVPAPGAGKINVFHAYAYKAIITGAMSDNPYFAYGDYNDTSAFATLGADDGGGGFLTITGTAVWSGQPYFTNHTQAYDYTNLPIVVQRDSTGGTATIDITVFYSIADVA